MVFTLFNISFITFSRQGFVNLFGKGIKPSGKTSTHIDPDLFIFLYKDLEDTNKEYYLKYTALRGQPVIIAAWQ